MSRFLLLLLVVVGIGSAQAQTLFKCKGADGKIQISDRACSTTSNMERLPDRAPVTAEQRYAAQLRAQRLQDEAANVDSEKAAAIAAQRADEQRQASVAAKQAAVAKTSADDQDAVANCVRDVERRGATQNVKAEMIAACRTAGLVQRSTGMTSDAVSECVKRVERTGATEKVKARQLATCHGADVQPEPPPPPKPKPSMIMSCDDGGCWDNVGGRYNRSGDMYFRNDGKACRVMGNMMRCD